MKVSRRSWHYKMWNYWRNFFDDRSGVWPPIPFKKQSRHEFRPKTLCSYFWQIVFFYTIWPVLLLAASLAVGGIAIGVSPIVGVVLLIFFTVRTFFRWLGRKIDESDRRKYPEGRPPHEPREPNVLIQYLKARKQKACPIIELVD